MQISFVIPAYNESKTITQTLKSIQHVASSSLLLDEREIIVVDNMSTDDTADLATQAGATVIPQTRKQHIAATRNEWLHHAQYSVVCFVDADSTITTRLIDAALARYARGSRLISAITSFDRYESIGAYGVWMYNLLSLVAKLGVGQFIVADRKMLVDLGGFDESGLAFEDLTLFRQWKQNHGRRSVSIVPICVISSGRKFTSRSWSIAFARQLFKAIIGGKQDDEFAKKFWYSKR